MSKTITFPAVEFVVPDGAIVEAINLYYDGEEDDWVCKIYAKEIYPGEDRNSNLAVEQAIQRFYRAWERQPK